MEFNDRQAIDCTLVIRIDIDLVFFHRLASKDISYKSQLGVRGALARRSWFAIDVRGVVQSLLQPRVRVEVMI